VAGINPVVFKNKRTIRDVKEFLYILPFILFVAFFSYYPLYGWVYAFFDYRPPLALSMKDFVGIKWFAYAASNPVRVQTILAVLRNTLVMSGITLATSWLPMLFAVFLNEIK
jgi:putative aldouronate transport system permease protein